MGTANLTTARTPLALWRADLALAGIALIWGATFVLVKQALQDASTLLFLALRFSLATMALALAFRPLPGKFARPRSLLEGGFLAGLCLSAGYVFQTVGLRYTSPSKSAFLTGLSVVLVPAFAALRHRQWPLPAEAAGVLAATAGMGLMTLNLETLRIERGDLLTLGCAVGFALHILVVGHYAPRVSFQALTLVQIATAAALALATCWWIEPPMIRWSPGRGGGAERYGAAGHRPGLLRASLGPALYHAHPHGPDLRARTGLRLADFLPPGRRAALPAGYRGGPADPGRDPAGGIETLWPLGSS